MTREGDEPPGELPPAPGQAERLRFGSKLLLLFPEVRSDILDEENSYGIAGTVALRARDRMQGLFSALEQGASDPSLNVHELAAFGVMEVLQDLSGVRPAGRCTAGPGREGALGRGPPVLGDRTFEQVLIPCPWAPTYSGE